MLSNEEKNMSIGVIVDFLFKSGGADQLTETMKESLPFTRTYDGCEEIYLYTDWTGPQESEHMW
jgi:hypothetical protein